MITLEAMQQSQNTELEYECMMTYGITPGKDENARIQMQPPATACNRLHLRATCLPRSPAGRLQSSAHQRCFPRGPSSPPGGRDSSIYAVVAMIHGVRNFLISNAETHGIFTDGLHWVFLHIQIQIQMCLHYQPNYQKPTLVSKKREELRQVGSETDSTQPIKPYKPIHWSFNTTLKLPSIYQGSRRVLTGTMDCFLWYLNAKMAEIDLVVFEAKRLGTYREHQVIIYMGMFHLL
ncbi:hypothetical protein BDV12DRAFT_194562 [Aspergillus spectabilis]